jgi:sodium/potassium-transporting ATPase subunit alpha
VFNYYGISASDLGTVNNKYFPSPDGVSYTSHSGDVFSHHDQKHILAIAQGSWFLMVVIGQAIHIWTCRTVKTSIFVHGLFTNMVTNFGVFIALCLGLIVVYMPGVQTVSMSYNPPSLTMLYGSLICFVVMFSWTELRKYLIRTTESSSLIHRILKY